MLPATQLDLRLVQRRAKTMSKLCIKDTSKPTSYGFSCGYTWSQITGPSNCYVQVYMEHGVYHIRAFRDGERIHWESHRKNREMWKRFKARVQFEKTMNKGK